MTGAERQALDVAAMQRELLDIAAKVEKIGAGQRDLLAQKADIDGKLMVSKAQLSYLKQQASAIQSALKSSTAF